MNFSIIVDTRFELSKTRNQKPLKISLCFLLLVNIGGGTWFQSHTSKLAQIFYFPCVYSKELGIKKCFYLLNIYIYIKKTTNIETWCRVIYISPRMRGVGEGLVRGVEED